MTDSEQNTIQKDNQSTSKELNKVIDLKTILEENGIKILLVHGSPRKNDENIFSNTPIEEVEKMLDVEYPIE